MKKVILINGLAALLLVFSSTSLYAESAESSDGEAAQSDEGNIKRDVGYFFGYSFGNILKEGGNEDIDIEGLIRGVEDSLALKYPDLSREQQEAVIAVVEANRAKRMEEEEAARAVAEAQQGEIAQENIVKSADYMKENARKDGVKSTASGLQYEVIEEGTGERPAETDAVRVNYTGTLIDGTIFDSTNERGPAEFRLRQVIPGWTEGLQLMTAGSKYRFTIPPDLAYGPGGTRGIPPNSVLVFEVELLEVK